MFAGIRINKTTNPHQGLLFSRCISQDCDIKRVYEVLSGNICLYILYIRYKGAGFDAPAFSVVEVFYR